ncbi:ATP-dependent helicase [Mesorhizobium sp. BAC0120]|uniref:ATP-dependent helicase n=1 Tax=Mesorhizobium sp. BAC0120 TaxID=3090670 RepID=UPI00298C51AA|nr:ATP-dependent helicase [Mesorhizobium sp. BAC0120]MDW6021862.1 ATP-dependent helicase [Mesorhizobium sp. BAC0120]
MKGRLLKPNEWTPVGVEELEDNAMKAVKASGNTLVTAGPGAGKTELLGQRGVYLLETGTCPFPRRILAISFKRDAARNLRQRFEQRCSKDQVGRLDSLTFDAFAKQVLDRFWRALPDPWGLRVPYKIIFSISPNEYAAFQREVADNLDNNAHPAGWATQLLGKKPSAAQVYSVNKQQFDAGINDLELQPLGVPSVAAFLQLVRLRWAFEQNTVLLSFPQIGRLAQLIVEANPSIREAMRATYSHLFVDEFQDTTGVQYGLARSIFRDSATVVTAVGDDKQRIMGWAGALDDSFGLFEKDFLPGGVNKGQERLSLVTNRRSNARIVEILNVLKERLAPGEPDFKAKRAVPALPPEQICSVVVSKTERDEAEALGEYVAKRLKEGKRPRDIALLVRQKPAEWEDQCAGVLLKHGVPVRNEDRQVGGASIQDLVADPYPRAVLDMLEFLTKARGGAVWGRLFELLCDLNAVEDGDEEANELADALDRFAEGNRVDGSGQPIDWAQAAALVDKIEAFIGLGNLQATAPHYLDRPYFDLIRGATRAFLKECIGAGRPLVEAIAAFRGDTSVPLMTITKSKGLEYDIVILLGLDDVQWWSFNKNAEEAHSNFFVAASRAKEQLFLTYNGKGTSKIGEVLTLLNKAGVDTLDSKAWASAYWTTDSL